MGKPIKIVGDKEIMRIEQSENGPYVLAYLPRKDEWVTWATDEKVENFFWGHYFREKADAEKDLQKRCEA